MKFHLVANKINEKNNIVNCLSLSNYLQIMSNPYWGHLRENI